MTAKNERSDATAAAIESRFPRWSVWISDTGYWWASLKEPLTAAERRARCMTYLRADDDVELTDLIREQDVNAAHACGLSTAPHRRKEHHGC